MFRVQKSIVNCAVWNKRHFLQDWNTTLVPGPLPGTSMPCTPSFWSPPAPGFQFPAHTQDGAGLRPSRLPQASLLVSAPGSAPPDRHSLTRCLCLGEEWTWLSREGRGMKQNQGGVAEPERTVPGAHTTDPG